jgi:DNA-binding beta-propeller fold protein YncE
MTRPRQSDLPPLKWSDSEYGAGTYEVKQYILVGQRRWHQELSPDGKKAYVANGPTNDMTVIDVETLKAGK